MMEFSKDIIAIENYGECKDSMLEKFIEIEKPSQGLITIFDKPNSYCPNLKYSCCTQKNFDYFVKRVLISSKNYRIIF